jgi:hypothetical protein
MDNASKLQSAIKRKLVLRETLHSTVGHKVKDCKVTYIEKGWYNFVIDGYQFECKWDNLFHTKSVFYFRNNIQLEKAGYCYEYGIDCDKVKYASSFNFGCGTDLIKVLWVLGEVLDKKKSYDFRRVE